MMCFRDMSFCSAADKCTTKPCGRRFTETDAIAARKWWGSDDAPVAYSDFSQRCELFREAKE